ncbi:MAG: sugar kinase [Gemmatimonadaceae bacterium]
MDLVTFGEGLVRLSGLGDARRLDAHVGGAELNVAVAAARLGTAARWISRLPDNALGRFIEGSARVHGVEARVEWTADGRVGLYFLEQGSAPRQSSVVYDRAGSSFSQIAPGTVDWLSLLRGARWFHVSGITPALSESAAAVTDEALKAAKAAGLTVSYDVNYRVKLWNASRARAVQEALMRYVDLLVVSEEDARTVFDARGESADDLARALAKRFAVDAVAVTVRDSVDGIGAVVVASGATYAGPRHNVEVVERVGTGDAFTAGLIVRRLENRGWEEAVRFATSIAALKLTMPGDFFVGQRSDVEGLLDKTTADPSLRSG